MVGRELQARYPPWACVLSVVLWDEKCKSGHLTQARWAGEVSTAANTRELTLER